MSTFYHYSSLDDWHGIEHGSWKSDGVPGLGASLRVCKDNFDDEGARDGAVFGLTEPEPASWIDNPDYPLAWKRFVGDTGRLLLAYGLTDDLVDRSYVIDWSHMEHGLGYHADELEKDTAFEMTYEDRVRAEKGYWGSRVPLGDYLEDPSILSRLFLPEVITMETVPFELIEVAEEQPRLHDLPPYAMRTLERAVEYNPSLEILGDYIK